MLSTNNGGSSSPAPLTDQTGSLLVLEFKDQDEAEEFAHSDPLYRSRCLRTGGNSSIYAGSPENKLTRCLHPLRPPGLFLRLKSSTLEALSSTILSGIVITCISGTHSPP
ncbi:MAG: YciI family protein [Nitrospiraceae bacterium]